MKTRPNNSAVFTLTVMVKNVEETREQRGEPQAPSLLSTMDELKATLRALEAQGVVRGFNFSDGAPAPSVVGPDGTRFSTTIR